MTRTGTVSERLRRETQADHDAVEHALAWETRAAAPAPYRRWLLRLHGFHRAWEPAVAEALAEPAFFDPRRKLHLLTADLVRLGAGEAEIAGSQRSALPMVFDGRADVLGSMYVLEGSMLGGQIIARHVRSAFGFVPRYHLAYGDATGTMWRTFKRKLDDDVGHEHLDQALASARRTFVCLRDLLARD